MIRNLQKINRLLHSSKRRTKNQQPIMALTESNEFKTGTKAPYFNLINTLDDTYLSSEEGVRLYKWSLSYAKSHPELFQSLSFSD